jgi:hypothetical protein
MWTAGFACGLDVGPVAYAGMRGLTDCDHPPLEEAPERADAGRDAAFLGQPRLYLLKADV